MPAARIRVLFAAFAAGAAVMLTELTAPRVLAPHFGTSWRLWVTLLGGTLVAMACGYWLAARRDHAAASQRQLGVLLLVSSALALPAPFFGQALGAALQPEPVPLAQLEHIDQGTFSALLVVLLLFMPAAACNAAAAPLCARLNRAADTATAASQVLSAGALGSILGTLAPVHWLLDDIGVRATLLCGAALTLCAGLLLLIQSPVTRKA